MSIRILIWQVLHEFGKQIEHCVGQFPLPTELVAYDEDVTHPSNSAALVVSHKCLYILVVHISCPKCVFEEDCDGQRANHA
ncbi:hypothetical protein ACJU26_06005 [Acidithiobacillus sp. M4-SHS-6]|uniref:hypothetical protein n=1 Tax=Acidithiobacillus sp. M4-SHS-6 TaxID=3383024 RepID=UPI0039BE3854